MSCIDDILNKLPVVMELRAGDVYDLHAELVNADNALFSWLPVAAEIITTGRTLCTMLLPFFGETKQTLE